MPFGPGPVNFDRVLYVRDVITFLSLDGRGMR
jgi:hypothetical protein